MDHSYKVVITASGTGSRLGELTQFVNKAVVRVGKRAAISYILDNIPLRVPIVVTLGYKKEQVKEYLEFAHPDRVFEFVEVDKYEGEGSSQGYSLLCAKSSIQTPFVYIACDTIFSMPISCPTENWIGGEKNKGTEQYTSVLVDDDDNIVSFQSKGAVKNDYVYAGISGIVDFAAFWEQLSKLYEESPNDKSLNDILAFSRMLEKGLCFKCKQVENWLDIGNETALKNARLQIADYFDNLEKLDESIYLFDNQYVIKFFHDTNIIQKRIARSRYLGDLVPLIDREGKYLYRYQYAKGDLYSHVVNPMNFPHFLSWCQEHLWKPVQITAEQKGQFNLHCRRFYFEKTLSRLDFFHRQNDLVDQPHRINFQEVPSLEEMFSLIRWGAIFDGRESGFHGDLHFENVIVNNGKYCLLDWRQDFDGLIEYGDTYYDLAKLNHGMIISHEIIRKNLFKIETNARDIICEILRPDNLAICQDRFYQFIKEQEFDTYKVDVLTALIFLNIAPLHHSPYNLFLYYFGKLRLWYTLNFFSVMDQDVWNSSIGSEATRKQMTKIYHDSLCNN